MMRVFGRVDIGMTGSCQASGTRREEHPAERGMIVRRSVYRQRTAMSQPGHGFLAAPPSRPGCRLPMSRSVVAPSVGIRRARSSSMRTDRQYDVEKRA